MPSKFKVHLMVISIEYKLHLVEANASKQNRKEKFSNFSIVKGHYSRMIKVTQPKFQLHLCHNI